MLEDINEWKVLKSTPLEPEKLVRFRRFTSPLSLEEEFIVFYFYKNGGLGKVVIVYLQFSGPSIKTLKYFCFVVILDGIFHWRVLKSTPFNPEKRARFQKCRYQNVRFLCFTWYHDQTASFA